MQEFLKGFLSIISTTLIFLFGGWDIALQSLIAVVILDYLTGLIKSYVKCSLNSSIGFRGIFKKLCIFIMVAIAVVIDNLTVKNGVIRSLIIYYLVANEGLSIIENLGEMNIIVPNFLKERLEQLKRGNKGDEK